MIILVVALLLLAPAVFDLCRRPVLRRLAFRNLRRRPTEAMLVVLGSLLGTAIITASLVVGDTLDASVRDIARVSQGPIDEQARLVGTDHLGDLESTLRTSVIPHTDGLLRAVWAPVAVATTDAIRRAEPKAVAVEVDFDAARQFGGDPPATGLANAGVTPNPGEAVIASDLAEQLKVGPGAPLQLFAYGTSLVVTVQKVVPSVGLVGWGSDGSRATTVFVAPGVLEAMAASTPSAAAAAAASPPNAVVWVSNSGGVFSGVRYSHEVAMAMASRVTAVPGTEVTEVKHDTLDDAVRAGRNFTQLFSSIGSFAVIAGVLLLVNIFVMLSEERKTELGVLRAVGLKRRHLVRSFGAEGSIYAVVAAAVGAALGVVVGAVIALVTRGLASGSDTRVVVRFAVNASTVRDGLCAGLVISLGTIWLTSIRLASLNVIRAIRDQPEPPRRSLGRRRGTALVATLAVGIALVIAGFSGSQSALLLGPSLVIVALAWFAYSRRPGRLAPSLGALAVLVWCIGSVWIVRDRMRDAPLSTFVVDGLILVGSAVTLLVLNADLLATVSTRGKAALTARLASAYPLVRRYRTGLLLGMYSLVIFTLTFLATFSAMLSAQGPDLLASTSAGYSVVVDSSPTNPLTAETLRSVEGVSGLSIVRRGSPDFTTDWQPERLSWPMSGFDHSVLDRGVIRLQSRSPQFPDDRTVWEAVLTDPSLAVVPDYFLRVNTGPVSHRLEVGDVFQVYDRLTGSTRQLKVAGVVAGDWAAYGAMVGKDSITSLLGPAAVDNRALVAVDKPRDADVVADRITGSLLDHGADARTLRGIIDDGLSTQAGFFRLMEGFLGLGLIIGIAGLGVVMVRAVRERRRQIAMLRAIGVPVDGVRRAFLAEAGIVAVAGTLLGIGLGLITAYQVLMVSTTFGTMPLDFVVPWATLFVIAVAPLAASLVATNVPARRASLIPPAAALRIAD